jgi:prophage regulatory protein
MLFEHTKPVAAQVKAAMIARQHALAAAIARVKALAEKERRDPTDEEIVEIEALDAALATLTRGINQANDLVPAAADTGRYHRGHALARGPPSSGCDTRILRWREVAQRTGLSRPTIWRLVRAGTFPRPVQLSSPAAVGWIASEVDAWIATRIAQRDLQVPRLTPERRGRPPRKAVVSSSELNHPET